MSAVNTEKLLRDVAADAQLVGYNSPAQNALLKGAEEIKRLRTELWVIASAIWENISRDEVKHWAEGIRVSIAGASEEPPTFTVAPTETAEILTADETKALQSMLEYAQGEHGKSQGGYFSSGGWCGHTLTKLLERAKSSKKAAEQS